MMGPTSLKEIRETLQRHFTKDGRARANRRTRPTAEGRKLMKELEQLIEALKKALPPGSPALKPPRRGTRLMESILKELAREKPRLAKKR